MDKRLFTEWVDCHHQALFKHAYWMVQDADVASDLVQETYYQAWKGKDTLRDREKVLPWLLTILRRNVYKEYGERTQRREALQQSIADVTPSASEEDRLAVIDLAGAMGKLSPVQRELVILYFLQGFSYKDISETLEIPIGAVMSRLSRARGALRTLMDKPHEGRVIELRRRREL